MTATRKTTRWPKSPPPLTAEQEVAREAFMALWHQELPRRYAFVENFNHGSFSKLALRPGIRTLEIGAGLGAHSKFENLGEQDYYCLEYREEFCRELRQLFPPDRITCGDIEQRQAWPDDFFDRIVAIHVLEHLRNLPAALAEIQRILRFDGIFDVVVPCEGGIAYSLARKISAERLFRKRFGMDYGPIIQNEHVSTFDEIECELGAFFAREARIFFPLRVAIPTLNLAVAYRLRPKRVHAA